MSHTGGGKGAGSGAAGAAAGGCAGATGGACAESALTDAPATSENSRAGLAGDLVKNFKLFISNDYPRALLPIHPMAARRQ